ncbi:MAG: NUDIX hydrolase [Promethearchaeota archaeon]
MGFSEEQKRLYDIRHYPVRPHVGVGGVITWNNAVLLVKRKFNPNQGLWAIPGGHLKLGESIEEGALRECLEETGLELHVRKLASVIDKIDWDPQGKVEYHYVLVDYWMDVDECTPDHPPIPIAQSDAQEAIFVPYEQLDSYALTTTVRQLFVDLGIMTK